MSARTPAEIARQTLQLLARRHLPPTPAHYQAVYEEVANVLPHEAFPQRRLRHIATLLPSQTPRQKQLTAQFVHAVEACDWLQLQTAIVEYAQLELTANALATALPSLPDDAPAAQLPSALVEPLARLIENTVGALGQEDARTQEISLQLVDFLRQAPPPIPALQQMLHNYSFRLSFLAQEQAQRERSIQQLLAMTVAHLRAVAQQDPPLQNLADKLCTAMEPAWSSQQLVDIQHHLKSLLFRHLELHTSQEEAHTRIKDLLAQYAQHMAHLSDHSSQHHQQLSNCAQRIQQAQHLGELTPLLQAVVESGNRLARESQHAMSTMHDLRQQALAQEKQIHQLSHRLQRMQDTSRHDPSTGALNAQGLQEALLAEAVRSQQRATPLSVALLQVQLPDTAEQALGLQAATLSLQHATQIARQTLRPQDDIARPHEQHLVLLLPDCPITEASHSLARLQHALAQQPLMHADTLAPVQLSVGLVEKQRDETPQRTLERALHAMQQALRMGGNRVVLG